MSTKKNIENFLKITKDVNAITLEDTDLKSEKQSPYFFRSDKFNNGLKSLHFCRGYIDTLVKGLERNVLDGCVLFGPAYKGISIVSALAQLMCLREGISVSWSHDRKEEKDHGEKGKIVGCPLRGRNVIIIDDVITSGGSIREAMSLVESEGGKVISVCVALDREEACGDVTEAKQLSFGYGIPALSIATFSNLVEFYVRNRLDGAELLIDYQQKNCIIS